MTRNLTYIIKYGQWDNMRLIGAGSPMRRIHFSTTWKPARINLVQFSAMQGIGNQEDHLCGAPIKRLLVTEICRLYHAWATATSQLHHQPEDERACNAILESLERRWAKADQDVFVAAVILNPLHKIAPFAKSVSFSAAGIYTLLSRLWTRFYKEQPPSSLFAEMRDYWSTFHRCSYTVQVPNW